MKLRDLIRLRAQPVAAQVSIAEVQDSFYDDFATEDSGRYWWWIRMVLLEPDELIVDDGKDDLYRLPFTLTDDGATFGEPTPVKIEYTDVAARSETVMAVCTGISKVRGEKVAAKFTSREESRLNADTEGGRMREHIEKMRAKLGLAATATDSEVLAAAAAHMEAAPAEGEGEQPTPAGPQNPEGDPEGSGEGEEGQGGEQPTPAGQPTGDEEGRESSSVQVDARAFAEMQRQAREGAEFAAAARRKEDADKIETALKSGKFPPARKAHYEALMKADRDGTYQLLDDLAENVVPVALRGQNSGAAETTVQQNSTLLEAFQAAHMPDVLERKKAIAAGTAQRQRVFIDS